MFIIYNNIKLLLCWHLWFCKISSFCKKFKDHCPSVPPYILPDGKPIKQAKQSENSILGHPVRWEYIARSNFQILILHFLMCANYPCTFVKSYNSNVRHFFPLSFHFHYSHRRSTSKLKAHHALHYINKDRVLSCCLRSRPIYPNVVGLPCLIKHYIKR